MDNSKRIKQETNYSYLKEKLSQIISEQMKKYRITGVSIAVVDVGKIIWSDGFGFSDKEKGTPASPKTVYKLGSITKVFTAIAIMQLFEQGLIDLDEQVTHYIPEFSVKSRFPESKPITIRDLMTHHSGLPCDNRNGFYTGSPYEKPERFTNTLSYLKETYQAFPNGLLYSYSNLGIALLGILIERVSGMNYEEYIHTNILQPLGMNQTSFEYLPVENKLLSKGYNKSKGQYENQIRDLPAGGLNSSVLDMAKFINFILGITDTEEKTLLRKETLDKMYQIQNAGNPIDFGFKTGLNWIMSWPSLEHMGKVIWHDGGSINYLSILTMMPEHRFGLIILTNSERGVYLNHLVADEAMRFLAHTKNIDIPNEAYEPKYISITDMESSKIIGKYATSMGIIDITKKDKILIAKMSGQFLQLIPQSDGWFSLKLLMFGKIPVNVKKLNSLRISVRQTDIGRIIGFEQLIGQNRFAQTMGIEFTAEPVLQEWSDAVGFYRVKEPNQLIDGFKLTYSNGILSLKARVRKLSNITFILKPISDSEAIIQGLGRFAGETVFLKKINESVAIYLSGLEFTK